MSSWPDSMRVDPIGSWPGALTTRRITAPFTADLTQTLPLLQRELRALAAKDARLQVAIPVDQFRLDGKPRATAKPHHPGVILTCQSKHGPLSYPCDTFTRWQDNLRAIALALEALRKVDRYGVTKRGEQYRGFLALESATPANPFYDGRTARDWLEREYSPNQQHSLRVVVRLAKRRAHPDQGGSASRFQMVMEAVAMLEREGLL